METINYKLSQGRNLYVVKNPGMKTIIVWFLYYMPLDSNASKNALLSKVLFRGSTNYKNSREISRFLYDRYGTTMGMSINLKGEIYTLGTYVNFINPGMADTDKKLTKDVLMLLYDVLFKPALKNNKFEKEYFESEKQNLLDMINNKVNNKGAYAFDRCIELMCKNEPYGIDRLGKKDWINGMSNDELAERYYEIVNKAPLNIYVMGNLDINTAIEYMDSNFEFGEAEEFPVRNSMFRRKEVEEIDEKMDISQGKLVMGFRTDIDLLNIDYPAMAVLNNLFGGGPQSRLFINLRERDNLCYSINSSIEKYKGLLIVSCGIDGKVKDMVKNKIIGILEDIKSGGMSDEELENAKKSAVKDICMIKDDHYTYLSYIQGLDIYKCPYSIDEFSRKLEDISRQDVERCCGTIKLDTVYFLGNR